MLSCSSIPILSLIQHSVFFSSSLNSNMRTEINTPDKLKHTKWKLEKMRFANIVSVWHMREPTKSFHWTTLSLSTRSLIVVVHFSNSTKHFVCISNEFSFYVCLHYLLRRAGRSFVSFQYSSLNCIAECFFYFALLLIRYEAQRSKVLKALSSMHLKAVVFMLFLLMLFTFYFIFFWIFQHKIWIRAIINTKMQLNQYIYYITLRVAGLCINSKRNYFMNFPMYLLYSFACRIRFRSSILNWHERWTKGKKNARDVLKNLAFYKLQRTKNSNIKSVSIQSDFYCLIRQATFHYEMSYLRST